MLSLFATLVALLPMAPQDPIATAQAAVTAAEEEHGADSTQVGDQLVRLVNALQQRGQLQDALPHAERALRIREARLPPGAQRTAVARTNLGAIRVALHDVEGGLSLFERAQRELAEAPPGRAMLGVLTNIGICQALLGDYGRALPQLEAAVAYAREHAEDHPYLAMALQNLAQMHLNFGEVERARACIDETLSILERTDAGGARYAHAVHAIGVVLSAAGRLEDAEVLLRRGLALRQKALGPDAADTADTAAALGAVLLARADLPGASQQIESALATYERTGRQRTIALQRATLARIRLEQGDGAGALAAAEQSVVLAGKLGITGGPAVDLLATHARALLHAGQRQAGRSALEQALTAAGESGALSNEATSDVRSLLATTLASDGDHGRAIALLRDNLQCHASAILPRLPLMLERARLRVLARHRRDLDQFLHLTAQHADALAPADVHREVLAWKGQVARGLQRQQLAVRRDPQNAARYARLLQISDELSKRPDDEGLRRERDRLETLLAQALPAYDDHAAAAQVAAAVPADTAFVDFAQYAGVGQLPHVTAFVVTPGGVRRCELGTAADVGRAIASHLLLVARSTRKGSERLAAAAAAAARARVFEPLAAAIGAHARVLVSPDGALATLPFETLPGRQPGRYLVEDIEFTYLQNGLDLLRPATPPTTPSLLAVGAVDYGAAAARAADENGAPRPFLPLPATTAELASLLPLLPADAAVALRGPDATVAALQRGVAGRTFVHLATHGFCAQGEGDAAVAGIALAGANLDDDGILDVEAAARLELSDCRLVVLSACESGLGKPLAGESLLGLRRALHIAGARATLTSLWRVDDAATAALMADFYRRMLQQGAPAPAAWRAAQLHALAAARRDHGEGLPAHWGAFVLEGRP